MNRKYVLYVTTMLLTYHVTGAVSMTPFSLFYKSVTVMTRLLIQILPTLVFLFVFFQ